MARTFTFDGLRDEYRSLWETMEITNKPRIYEAARKVIQNRSRYEEIQKLTGIPWQFIGVLHLRESSCNFNTHLHNGDSLARRTRRVPAGRPKAAPANGLRYTWVESALDALKIKGLDKIDDWSIERMCYEGERFNGFGYRMSRSRPLSPYLFAGSNHYTKGKFYSDGKYSSTLVDVQPGIIPTLKMIQEITGASAVPGTSSWMTKLGKWTGLGGLSLTAMAQQFADFITDWKTLAIIFGLLSVTTIALLLIERRRLREYREGRYIPSDLKEGSDV